MKYKIGLIFYGCVSLLLHGAVFAGGLPTPVSGPDSFPLTWTLERGIRLPNGRSPNIAPDVQQMSNGVYRMYYTVTGEGVGSAISNDGLQLLNQDGSAVREIFGDVSLIRLSDGSLRMFSNGPNGIQSYVPQSH